MGFKDYKNKSEINEEKYKEDSKKIEDIYNTYKNKSQDELTYELLKHVENQKKDGTFNYDSLCEMLNKVSPFLTKDQKLKMNELLKKLK